MSQPKTIKTCSIHRALEVVGDKPTLLLLESYWLGTRRFSAFQTQTGLLKTVVSNRLTKLIAAGCFERVLYSDRPKRYEYRGTEKFYALYPVALAMLQWERDYGGGDGKIHLKLRHINCKQETRPFSVCAQCRAPIIPQDVTRTHGPGAGQMPAEYSRRRRQSASPRPIVTPLFDEIADIIGDRWSALIIRALFAGVDTFQDICAETGIATNILAQRLERLCAAHVLEKRGGIYYLLPKGQALYPVLIALMQWGDNWCGANAGPPVVLTHTPCGAALTLRAACSHCGVDVSMTDIKFEFA